MKRLVLLTLALFLYCGAAEALTVPEHIALPPFETATGLTHITMDAAVEMPDISAVNIYEVAPKVFDEQEALQLVRAFGFDTVRQVKYASQSSEKGNWTTYVNYSENTFEAHNNQYDLYMTNAFVKDEPANAHVQMELSKTQTEYSVNSPLYASLPGAGCKYTKDEAQRMAEELAAAVAPELQLRVSGVLIGTAQLSDELIAAINDPKSGVTAPDITIPFAYHFIFTRVLDGIPVTATTTRISSDASYAPPFQEERLSIIVSDEGIDNAYYASPYEVKGVLQAGLTDFVPFEEIVQIAKSVLPLKLVTSELNKSQRTYFEQRNIHIDRVVFGYMRVMMRDQPGRYQMIPVWDFFGTEVIKTKDRSSYYNEMLVSYLTLNALDGTVIDREYGY